MEAAVTKFSHSSELEDYAIVQMQVKERLKAAQGFAIIVMWDDINQKSPSNLKFSLLAMIPHKSRKYRAVLGLLFALKVAGLDLTLLNGATK